MPGLAGPAGGRLAHPAREPTRNRITSSRYRIVNESIFPPLDPVAVRRILLVPARRLTVTVASFQVDHEPVGAKPSDELATTPLTRRASGRLVLPALA